MAELNKYPTFEIDFDIVTDFVENMGCANPVEGYAVIEGARYALETYKKEADAGRSVGFNVIVAQTRGVLVSEGFSDLDPWKSSDEFYLGIALGTFIARRADGRMIK